MVDASIFKHMSPAMDNAAGQSLARTRAMTDGETRPSTAVDNVVNYVVGTAVMTAVQRTAHTGSGTGAIPRDPLPARLSNAHRVPNARRRVRRPTVAIGGAVAAWAGGPSATGTMTPPPAGTTADVVT